MLIALMMQTGLELTEIDIWREGRIKLTKIESIIRALHQNYPKSAKFMQRVMEIKIKQVKVKDCACTYD